MEILDINKKLIQKAKKGDVNAFEQLVLAHEKKVFNIAFRIMGNQEDAYDISQETFIKVFRNLEKFNEKSTFSTWVYRIATNSCLDELRKRKGKETDSLDKEIEAKDSSVLKQVASKDSSPEEHFFEQIENKEISDAINSLPDDQKSVVVLRDINGFSYNEIEQITEVSIGTIKSRISRGRAQLKKILLKNRELNENNIRHNN